MSCVTVILAFYGLLTYFEEVGHTTKCCHFYTINFFQTNFSRTLIRARTGSFANVLPGVNLKNIKLGQIFGLSKNGSWALVDAHNFFFFDLLIRRQTGAEFVMRHSHFRILRALDLV